MDLDEFGDDDFDALPDNTWSALEEHALTSTQKPDAVRSRPLPTRDQRLDLANESRRPPANDAPPASAPELPSSDYGFEDEDVIDLDEPSVVLPSRSALQPPPGAARPHLSTSHKAPRVELDPETEAAFAAADAELGTHRPGQWEAAPHLQSTEDRGEDLRALQARVAQLEAEQAQLRNSEQQARDALLAKQGEISIVRANQEKATKEYERRIEAMQKRHADEEAKQKVELDAGRKEREKMETDNRFLQHDLRQEAERSKRLTGPGKTRLRTNGQTETTPQKPKKPRMGDGFSNDEVLRVSPSKTKDHNAEQSPKNGTKRKRTAQDSPIPVLSFSQPSPKSQNMDVGQPQPASQQQDSGRSNGRDDRYESLQRMLNHVANGNDQRSIERLAQFPSPSNPAKSLASVLIEGMTAPILSSDKNNFSLRTAQTLLSIWSDCLKHDCFPPLRLLLDFLRAALRFELSPTIAALIDEAVPLCIESISLVAVAVAQASVNPVSAAPAQQKASVDLRNSVDVDEIMDLLGGFCDAASLSSDSSEAFWRKMDFSFTLLMLNKAQPLSQIRSGLRILATSAFPSTFGCILPYSGDQAVRERHTVEKLMNLLSEIPEPTGQEPPYTNEELAELRIDVLKVLKAMCMTTHGGMLLAQHLTAIGKLIRFIDTQVNALYNTRPSIGLDLDRNRESPALPPSRPLHDLIVETINTSVILLYHLLKTYGDSISFPAKTSAVKGGHHRFIVAMTRIAFSDQLVFEAGISDQAVEAAHTILDDILNPEEGEAIMKAVETPRGTRSSAHGIRTGDTTEVATDEEAENDINMLDAG